MNKPKVSVCMITYNHEAFIKEAIQGVLDQKTIFTIELIISNDASTDKTNEVISTLVNNSENISIKYFNQVENIGMMPNFIFALEKCKGDYIALCEGDDYWTDSLKLQKQVDFLEKNNKFSLCFHKVKILNIDQELVDDFITEERFEKIKEYPISQKSLFDNSNFIHTPSVMFRNMITDFPLELELSPVGDYFLYFMISNHGYMHRIDEVMGVYRYGNGIYSKLTKNEKRIIGSKFQVCLLSYTNSEYIKRKIIGKMYKDIIFYEKNNINNTSIKELLILIIKRIINKFS